MRGAASRDAAAPAPAAPPALHASSLSPRAADLERERRALLDRQADLRARMQQAQAQAQPEAAAADDCFELSSVGTAETAASPQAPRSEAEAAGHYLRFERSELRGELSALESELGRLLVMKQTGAVRCAVPLSPRSPLGVEYEETGGGGVAVTGVAEWGSARGSGLEPGMRIVGAGAAGVRTGADLRTALAEAREAGLPAIGVDVVPQRRSSLSARRSVSPERAPSVAAAAAAAAVATPPVHPVERQPRERAAMPAKKPPQRVEAAEAAVAAAAATTPPHPDLRGVVAGLESTQRMLLEKTAAMEEELRGLKKAAQAPPPPPQQQQQQQPRAVPALPAEGFEVRTVPAEDGGVRAPRFAVGQTVECNVGGQWRTGVVLETLWRGKTWDRARPPVPYQIRVAVTGQVVYAALDDDRAVRAPVAGDGHKPGGAPAARGPAANPRAPRVVAPLPQQQQRRRSVGHSVSVSPETIPPSGMNTWP